MDTWIICEWGYCQMQDGSFVSQAYDDQGNEFMLAFDAGGSIRWSVPNEYPVIAIAVEKSLDFFAPSILFRRSRVRPGWQILSSRGLY